MMKDSKIPAEWLREQMRLNPPAALPSGNMLTGPVRISFPNLFKPGKPGRDAPAGSTGKFGCAVLFPLGADITLLRNAWIRMAREAFPKNWDAQGNAVGLHHPFHDQSEKAYGVKPLAGYTPGAITFNCSSQYKPAIVDPAMNKIEDEGRVYPGVWAILSVNLYKFEIPQKKGISFGLQTVMVIADDQKLAGGGADPSKEFANVVIAPIGNIAAAFETAPIAGAPPLAAGGTLLPAGGYVGTPGSMPVHALPSDQPSLRWVGDTPPASGSAGVNWDEPDPWA